MSSAVKMLSFTDYLLLAVVFDLDWANNFLCFVGN